ncbi:nitroreductase family deazaflavin-dependent oxidoreductase [Hoyosella subflava]|uniref:Deazaflavin-dependent nitroreductase family protein n=1 Tax=Hoyosella subflava (strain DSM 45089 / JCM 17490 / NBRC 109087 / DQS3-9A1) TaxID=443218 RepID=F6EMF6_HOYSD|nr:nitroreductase family deazaflavin-dependent oxidoreductase [Hoyosella subflava]AEF40316.1 hypothetical protein AS9A_1867 [Hoyosella subflava DQS3-9A1]
MPFPVVLARFNRHVTNRLAMLAAGRVPGYGIVVHKGRRSGNVYQTPVNVFPDGSGGYRIALTYGTGSDWVQNVLAAGECTLETRGTAVTLVNPVVETDRRYGWAPPFARLVLRAINAPHCLHCRAE